MPLIRDNVQTAWIYLGILALDAFVYMAALNPGGGPNNSTLVMAQQLFTTAFTKGQFGVACAMGVVLAAVTLLFAALVFIVNRLLGGKEDAAMSSTTVTDTGTRPRRSSRASSEATHGRARLRRRHRTPS